MSKKKLSVIICLIMFFCITLLTGCGSVSFSMVQYEDGKILQNFSVSLNQQTLEQNGFDYQASQAKVELELNQVINNLKQRFELTSEEDCSSEVKEQVFSGLTTKVFKKDNVIFAQMCFSSSTDYKYFYGLNKETSDEDNSGYVVKEYPFYKKVFTASYSKFYNYMEDEIYKQAVVNMQEYFKKDDEQSVFTEDSLNYVYCYALSKNYHLRSNADVVYSSNGLDFHCWSLTSSNLDRVLIFYQVVAKPMLWYVLVLGLTLIVVLIVFVVSLFVDKFGKKKQTEENSFAGSKQAKALEEIYKKIEDGSINKINISDFENSEE